MSASPVPSRRNRPSNMTMDEKQSMSGSSSTHISSSSHRRRRAPYLPTELEAFLLSIYPATLLLGSLFSLLDPSARGAPYSATLQSHPPEFAPSYFAQKRNIFNTLFVKRGWFWTTLAFFVFLFAHPSTGPSRSLVLTPRRVKGALRWGLVTAWWIVTTQWFFGPPLIDRGFRFTGGQCELVSTEEGREDMSGTREVLTGAACKLAGGKWKGGTDISGHVFLLVLGSAFLWMEILPVVLRAAGLREKRLIVATDTKVRNAEAESQPEGENAAPQEDQTGSNLGVNVPLGVAGLSWWMLLMTAAYFHTWFEKFTGLLVAFIGIFIVYFLPRALPSFRSVIGMPGV
ncbi:MAG: hypothetical protein M1827_006236 [Pycnora praestabilis]|nr:MAG: hypothetical protein M1827_006236 [Pycnora praestabilis]